MVCQQQRPQATTETRARSPKRRMAASPSSSTRGRTSRHTRSSNHSLGAKPPWSTLGFDYESPPEKFENDFIGPIKLLRQCCPLLWHCWLLLAAAVAVLPSAVSVLCAAVALLPAALVLLPRCRAVPAAIQDLNQLVTTIGKQEIMGSNLTLIACEVSIIGSQRTLKRA